MRDLFDSLDSITDGASPSPGPLMRPNVYTVPLGTPFLDALARAILAGDLPRAGGPKPSLIDLPGFTILLPSRRAVRAAREGFLRAGAGRAMLLPRIRTIGEGDEEQGLIAGLATSSDIADLDLPQAVGELDRRLLLSQLVLQWSGAMRKGAGDQPYAAAGASTPAQAIALATELARLMDMVETEGVGLDRLETLVPDAFSAHWQKTLDFLTIITQHWPALLAARQRVSPAMRRHALLAAEAARIGNGIPSGPVIVAGVIGGNPALAGLMTAVAGRHDGAVVVEGLDQELDQDTWGALVPGHPEHPQFGLNRLLAQVGVRREDVAVLAAAHSPAAIRPRATLLAEAMRPAFATARWHDYVAGADRESVRQSLAGLDLIEAPSAQDEAEVVALILRHAAETPGQTAALVTPDRVLARRVAVRLAAWGIHVDDSAGRPFGKTVPGTFLDLILEAVRTDFAPADLMALLKHPLTRLGLPARDVRLAARSLEIAVFRGLYLGKGLASILEAVEQAEAAIRTRSRRDTPARRLSDTSWAAIHDLVGRLEAAIRDLAGLFEGGNPQSLQVLAAAHVGAAQALARQPDDDAARSALWHGDAGTAAASLFTGLMDPDLTAPLLEPSNYPDFYRALIADETVLTRHPAHPRLFIWGPLEARLQQSDVMVLGSLNEGTWPAAADPGPWLNRPMRATLGLPAPEEQIGRAAHDICALLGGGTVHMTRATKVGGVPTVKSRWLLRLEALLAGMGLSDALKASTPWLGWARARDHVSKRNPIRQPQPRPALALRPRRLSVSDVETWIANPYAIYARHILGLQPLDPIGDLPGAALRGSIIHAALGAFANSHPDDVPPDAMAQLLERANREMELYAAHPRVRAFWQPRFERFAGWFARTEAARRLPSGLVLAEVEGASVLSVPGGPFTLRARADRIDISANDIVVSDYKTGTPPTDKAVQMGLAPQLPLEAAIVAAGGFAHVPARTVSALRYIRATGGEPPGEEHVVHLPSVQAVAEAAITGLERLIVKFDDIATPYRPTQRAQFAQAARFDRYAHLARTAEWSAGEGEDEEGEEP